MELSIINFDDIKMNNFSWSAIIVELCQSARINRTRPGRANVKRPMLFEESFVF
jgi:hypothetical protein